MMKRSVWFCILLTVLGTHFVAGTITKNGNAGAREATSRKLKDGEIPSRSDQASLDDYQPVDPSPSSKAVLSGPIEHGTPLIPYIPRLSPPPSSPRSLDYP